MLSLLDPPIRRGSGRESLVFGGAVGSEGAAAAAAPLHVVAP